MSWIHDRTVLVTGGNTGIGKATATELAARGAHVTIACRDAQRAAAARAEIEAATGRDIGVVALDLGSLASVRAAAAAIRDHLPPIDVLINNAGVAVFGRRRTTGDGFERQFGVNHLGHFLLTTLLDGHITGRVVNVSSAGYALARHGLDWDDLQWEQRYDGWEAYGASKLCNLYFTWELADRWRDRGIDVNALHPGFVDTELGWRRPDEGGKPRPALDSLTSSDAGGTNIDLSALGAPLTPEDGARTSLLLATDPDLGGVTGTYWDDHQQRVDDLGPIAHDRDASARLWSVSESLVAERA
jgi:NAD(P)-dependent dehydrogenase (short-subunit alcohol dehydrogenase family)